MHPETANALIETRQLLAEWVTDRFFERHPDFAAKWGALGRVRCTEDTVFHILYLAEAARFDFQALFTDYLGWTKILLHHLRLSDDDLRENLVLLVEAIEKHLAPVHTKVCARYIGAGLEALPGLPVTVPSFVEAAAPYASLANAWMDLLLGHQPKEARRLILQSVKNGAPVLDLYQHVFTPVLQEVGRLWQTRQITEAEEHYCSQATQTILAVLSGEVFAPRFRKSAVGFSVGNEQHEIGIRLVIDCFAMHGWDTACFGSNVPTRNIDSILRDWSPDIIAISTTMTYHLGELQRAVQAVRNSTFEPKPMILVGGRPFNLCPELALRVGADMTAASCTDMITCAVRALT